MGRTRIVLIVLVITVGAFGYLQVRRSHASSDDGFRGMPWGSSQAYVRSHEAMQRIQDVPGELMYTGTIDNLDVYAAYFFVEPDDHLAQAGYIFDGHHASGAAWLADYNLVKKKLTAKYGAPLSDIPIWIGPEKGSSIEAYGKAIASGDLQLMTTWSGAGAMITLDLRHDSTGFVHRLMYESSRYMDAYNAYRDRTTGSGAF